MIPSRSRPIRWPVLLSAAVALVGVVALAYLAVWRSPGPAAPAKDLAGPQSAAYGLDRPPPASEMPAMPERGGLVILGDADALTVLANELPPRTIVAEIGDHLDLGIALHARLDDRRISLQAVQERLGSVLVRLLGETPYSLHYDGDVLVRLEIGVRGSPAAVQARNDPGRPPGELEGLSPEEAAWIQEERDREADRPQERRAPRQSEAERRRFLEGRAQRQQLRDQENLLALQDPDPKERGNVVRVLDAENPEELPYLETALVNDPDPYVREEAARQLGFGEPAEVMPMLRQALHDPESEVVLAALDSIGFVGDRSVVRDLRPLLKHSNELVRDEARDTIEFLEMVSR